MAKVDPKTSEGARLERKAMRAKIRRLQLTIADANVQHALAALLAWVVSRQERYDRRVGGLGKQ